MLGSCRRRPGAAAAWAALFLLALPALTRPAAAQVAAGAAIAAGQPLDEVLARVHSRAAAATGHELLTALNATAGSSVDQLITLTGAGQGVMGQGTAKGSGMT